MDNKKGFASWLCHFLIKANYLTCLDLSFLICKVGIVIISLTLVETMNELIYVKDSECGLAHSMC